MIAMRYDFFFYAIGCLLFLEFGKDYEALIGIGTLDLGDC